MIIKIIKTLILVIVIHAKFEHLIFYCQCLFCQSLTLNLKVAFTKLWVAKFFKYDDLNVILLYLKLHISIFNRLIIRRFPFFSLLSFFKEHHLKLCLKVYHHDRHRQ